MENSKEFNKQAALQLIHNLQLIAEKDDKEMIRLYRLQKPNYAVAGESAMSYHLKVLQELVEKL